MKSTDVIKIFIGSSIGLLFPAIFIFIDLKQLGAGFSYDEILFVSKSQNIYIFSLIIFPFVSGLVSYLFLRVSKFNIELLKEQKKSAMNSKLAALGTLSAGIGHEINNPLAVIRANIEMYLIKGNLDNKWSKKFKDSLEMVDRIKHIVDGLKNTARDKEEEKKVIDLNNAVEKVVELLKEIYARDQILLETDLVKDKTTFYGFEGKFQQILINLISNAKDAILEAKNEGSIKIITTRKKDVLRVIVKDDGNGIDKKNLDKIFDTFFTTKEIGKGSGMGLSFVYEFTKEIGGEINVVSKISQGTEFIIDLPFTKDNLENSTKDNNKFEIRDDVSEKFALVVDDEEEISDVLSEVLEGLNFKTNVKENGKDALDYIMEALKNNKKIDIIFTDIKMPVMDGVTFIKKLQENNINIPVVVISGGSSVNVEKLLQDHLFVKEYLKKPFRIVDIQRILSNYISLSGPETCDKS